MEITGWQLGKVDFNIAGFQKIAVIRKCDWSQFAGEKVFGFVKICDVWRQIERKDGIFDELEYIFSNCNILEMIIKHPYCKWFEAGRAPSRKIMMSSNFHTHQGRTCKMTRESLMTHTRIFSLSKTNNKCTNLSYSFSRSCHFFQMRTIQNNEKGSIVSSP